MNIDDIIQPRKDIAEGKFQGVLQTHKVESEENRLESNPNELFEVTYLSNAFKSVIKHANQKLTGNSNQGAILLTGPYGSGKTHSLISLYHAFRNPSLAKKWLSGWNVRLEIPDDIQTAIVSTRNWDGDFLWEPVFEKLGREEISSKVNKYPTVEQIEELLEDGSCAIFLDEIENWYGSFDPDKQADLLERNDTFIEHLFEVASDANRNLLVFFTFLEQKEGLKQIINRTNPIRVDISATGDKEKIILYRLFRDSLKDTAKIESVVESYIEKYVHPIEIDNKLNLKPKMINLYPFHPQLLEVLDQIYESAAERQDIRGMMTVLADVVQKTYTKKDLILISDLDENAFRGMDLNLVERFGYDEPRVEELAHGYEILKSVLLFTLNDKTIGATESDILLSVFRPSDGHTLNALLMDITNIYGMAHYLHKDDSYYLFKQDVNIFALIEREKDKISEDELRAKLIEITREEVFENRVFIKEANQIPDDKKIKIVVFFEEIDERNIESEITDFLSGRSWQNTLIFYVPNAKSPLSSLEIQEMTRRLLAAQNLRQDSDDKDRLDKIISEEETKIIQNLRSMYGRWIKSAVDDNDEMRYRFISAEPDVSLIREKSASDIGIVCDTIVEMVSGKPDGVKIEFVLNDFKKFRKYPLVLSDNEVFDAIKRLYQDNRVIIQGDRGKWYIDESLPILENDYVLFDPQFTPPSEIEEEESEMEIDTDEEGSKSEEDEEGKITPEPKEEVGKVKIPLELKGNSPRVLVSQIEARTQESDEFKAIEISYRFSSELSKDEIMKFVKKFPDEDADIKASIEIWREG